MDKSINALDQLAANFAALKNGRPHEFGSAQSPHPSGLTYETLDALFTGWRDSLESARTVKWADPSVAALADFALSAQIAEVSGLVSQAIGNSVGWLLAVNFAQRCLAVTETISVLSDRRTGLVKSIGKALAQKGVEEIGKALEAAPFIAEVESKTRQLDAAVSDVSGKAETVVLEASRISAAAEKLAALQTDISDAHTSFLEKRADAVRLHEEMASVRKRTDDDADRLETRVRDLDNSISAVTETLNAARASLQDSLLDVKRVGLSQAFSSRARSVLHERYVWLLLMLAAALGLLLSTQILVSELEKLSYETLIVALLRRLALIGPLIWLGWYAARQVGRLNRVHEDYEYKAATALAFESYKNEVSAHGDAELVADLLKTTVRNFGDNPVRLYGNLDEEPNSPIEDLVGRLKKDGTLDTLRQLAEIWPGKPAK